MQVVCSLPVSYTHLDVYKRQGVGALKGWNGTEATHIKPVVNRTERVLASGPVRAIVEAEVIGWEYQETI